MQHFKFMNWRIRGFVFWCHEQVNTSNPLIQPGHLGGDPRQRGPHGPDNTMSALKSPSSNLSSFLDKSKGKIKSFDDSTKIVLGSWVLSKRLKFAVQIVVLRTETKFDENSALLMFDNWILSQKLTKTFAVKYFPLIICSFSWFKNKTKEETSQNLISFLLI